MIAKVMKLDVPGFLKSGHICVLSVYWYDYVAIEGMEMNYFHMMDVKIKITSVSRKLELIVCANNSR